MSNNIGSQTVACRIAIHYFIYSIGAIASVYSIAIKCGVYSITIIAIQTINGINTINRIHRIHRVVASSYALVILYSIAIIYLLDIVAINGIRYVTYGVYALAIKTINYYRVKMMKQKITSLWTDLHNNLHARLSDGQEKCIAIFTNEANSSCFEDLLKDLKRMLRMD